VRGSDTPFAEERPTGDDAIEGANDVGAFYTDEAVGTFLARKGLWETLRSNLLSAGSVAGPGGIDPELVRDIGADDRSDSVDGTTGFDVLYRHYEDDPAALETIDETLRDLTVCDPAAGDGSVLLAVARTLFEWRSRCVDRDPAPLRREILCRNLFGVDLRPAATTACRRRLQRWARGDHEAKASEVTLPDLTERIRTGNSLVGFVDSEPVREVLSASDPPRASIADHHQTLCTRLDERYATRQRRAESGPRMSDHVESVAETRRSLAATPDCSPSLRVTVPEGLPNGLATELDRRGFTVYTYTARLDDPTLDGDTSADGPVNGETSADGGLDESFLRAVFERLRSDSAVEEWSVIVEREYAGSDFADRIEAIHWPLAFPSAVLADGGFDLVVGNPPYGATLDPEMKALVTSECNYECQNAVDTCEWFYERALDLARESGVVSFVVTKALAFYGSWADIREKLLAETDTRHVFDVGLGFEDVNLETIALVNVLDDGSVSHTRERTEAGTETAVYRSEDRKDERANRPVLAGSVDGRIMRDAGTIVFSPVTDEQSDALDRILDCERRLGDVLSGDGTTRQLYIPDSEKADLDAGNGAYINKNHWVQPFYLEDVWHCDLEAYREAVDAYAVPRVMVKVLRGSRLRAWLDPHGELVGTEKLVNVPLIESSPAEIAFVYAALNHPCVSFYLQTAVFSGTTETARVMDGRYSTPIPIPDPAPTVESAVATLAWTLTLARQLAYDSTTGAGDTDSTRGPTCDRLQGGLDALVAGCYLDVCTDRVHEWSETLLADGPPVDHVRELFESFYTARYATPDGNPQQYWTDIESVTAGVGSMLEEWETERVCDSPAMDAIKNAL